MKKNFIKMFVLIFLISNLIFSENKKLNENYGIEDGEVYYINRKIEGADAKTFEVFEDGEYAKDKNNVYYEENVLNEADPKSFKLLTKISYGLSKDKNNLYFWENKVNNTDVKTLEIMTDEFSIYLKDKNGVYILFSYNGGLPVDLDNVIMSPKILKNVDKQTFQLIGGGYSKDKNSVYSGSRSLGFWKDGKIKDPETFEFLSEKIEYSSFYGKDKYNVYYIEIIQSDCLGTDASISYEIHKIEGINKDKVKFLNKKFIKDDKNIYFKGKILEGADYNTFEVLPNGDGKDKNQSYE